MFEKLRQAFREALDNFWEELRREEVPEAVDRLTRRMREELLRAKLYVRELEEEVGRTDGMRRREAENLETCRRRERLARGIGDEETAAVAAAYARRHQERLQVLEEKGEALRAELSLRRREVVEMVQKLQEALRSRTRLGAQAGRTAARESLQEADALFQELDRMAQEIRDAEGVSEALGEVAAEPGKGPEAREADVEARLRELKERMGRR